MVVAAIVGGCLGAEGALSDARAGPRACSSSCSSSAWPGGVVGRIEGQLVLDLVPGLVCVPFLGLLAAVFYRSTPTSSAASVPCCGGHQAHDAVCMGCGDELAFPEWRSRSEARSPAAGQLAGRRSRLRAHPARARPPAPLAKRLFIARAPRARTCAHPVPDPRRRECLMRAVDAMMECLKAEGVDVVFGLPGGANLPTYDAFVDAGIRHILVATRPAAATPPRATRRRPARSASSLGDQRPGRDEPGHADHRRDDGLRPGGGHHRAGAHRAARHRRLPGGGHDRHHDADRQAQLHDPAPAGAPAHRSTRRSTSPAPAGPARSSSTSPRTSAAPTSTTSRSTTSTCPATSRPPTATRSRSGSPRKALANARRPVLYAGGGVVSANAAAELTELHRRPLPGHLHGDGPGGLPGPARPVAGDARHARDPHGQLRDGRGRPDRRHRGSLDDRITGKLSEFAPRAKFIHIDIDPARSPRTSPPTSRSSATRRTSCPG